MKKIFTLILAACTAASAWAYVPEIFFKDNPVEPGKTYETGYEIEEIDLGVLVMKTYTQNSDLYLKGIMGEEITVVVDASSPVGVCSITGQCTSGDHVEKTGLFGSADLISDDGDFGLIDMRIENVVSDPTGVADPNTLLSNITVKVKAYYNFSPQEVAETTVILTNKPASEFNGIADVQVEKKDDISLGASNTLNYTVSAPVKLDIYNVNGALVMSRTIKGIGSISMDSLNPGMYIYTIGTKSGKILVHK